MNNPVCSAEAESPGAFPTVILHLQIPLTPSINDQTFPPILRWDFPSHPLRTRCIPVSDCREAFAPNKPVFILACQAQIARLNLLSRRSSLMQVSFHVLVPLLGCGPVLQSLVGAEAHRRDGHCQQVMQPFCKDEALKTQNSCCSAGPVSSHKTKLLKWLWAHSPKQLRAPPHTSRKFNRD